MPSSAARLTRPISTRKTPLIEVPHTPVSTIRVFRGMRHGHYDEAELEQQLDSRGFLNRVLGRVTRAVSKPWHMYPTGFLFGLGFDTRSEERRVGKECRTRWAPCPRKDNW